MSVTTSQQMMQGKNKDRPPRGKEGTTNDVTDDHNSFIARVKA